ncbi:MAG TPA: hypothetical protein VG167_06735 [Verrucomicrobiae bacterium]|nr:hypothetical protein [Verrucomicrobiae bacterium]
MSTLSNLLASGFIVRQPPGNGPGYWAGAPGAFYEPSERAWYLTYRLRRPRGVEPDRGGETRIARSTDLRHWDDVWSVTKDRFGSASIERCALRLGPDGWWRYFVSFVDPADGRWCLSVLKARDVSRFSPAEMRPVFKAPPLGLEGIKDPWIFQSQNTFYLLLSVALPTASTTAQSHATLDIYNTGECVSATGLAHSSDLDTWTWDGVVFAPAASGWDRYCRRLNSVLPLNGKFYGFYDGSAGHFENYEERTGLAVSSNLREWTCLTPDSPLVTNTHGSGSLRYVDASVSGAQATLFYELARPDGAHELRLATVPVSELLG